MMIATALRATAGSTSSFAAILAIRSSMIRTSLANDNIAGHARRCWFSRRLQPELLMTGRAVLADRFDLRLEAFERRGGLGRCFRIGHHLHRQCHERRLVLPDCRVGLGVAGVAAVGEERRENFVVV